jgi:hypothetical protein
LAASPEAGEVPSDLPSHDYNVLTATYLDKTYADVVLRLADSGAEMELREWTSKKKEAQSVVARFRLEPNAEVSLDGPQLKVAELAITLESPSTATQVALTLGLRGREREALRLLLEAESSVGGFLETREQAMNLLSWLKADPRGAMLSVESLWTEPGTEPLDAVYASYSARVAESFGRMTSSLSGAEKGLGTPATEMLYALTYTIGAVQDALLQGDSDMAPELAALKEFGMTATAEELRTEKPSARLVALAHPALVAVATGGTPAS